MAQTANIPAHSFAHASASQPASRVVPLEERVAVLEAHRESLTPALATKADVRGAENRMILWILGAALALAGLSLTLLSASEGRLDKRMDGLDKRMDGLDKRIDGLDKRMDGLDKRMDGLEARIDRLDAKIDSRFDALMAELRAQGRSQ